MLVASHLHWFLLYFSFLITYGKFKNQLIVATFTKTDLLDYNLKLKKFLPFLPPALPGTKSYGTFIKTNYHILRKDKDQNRNRVLIINVLKMHLHLWINMLN